MAKSPLVEEPGKPDESPPPPLSRNLITYAGWGVTIVAAVMTLVLVASDILFHREQPYNAMVTYLIMPGVVGAGVGLIFLGIAVEWVRRHRSAPHYYPPLPTVDLNKDWMRRRILLGAGMLTVLFGTSAVGIYQTYHYTESTEFCGLVCHQVMEPEYTSYQHSPHARVLCTECHIGTGAEWYVRSKVDGLRQVYAMLTNTYTLPIEVPVHNLRPARDTCEQCHWPGHFSGEMVRQIWHFSPDQANTPMRYSMLMKVGGGKPRIGEGQGEGIHWHISPDVTVRYWPTDWSRMEIPWVEVTVADEEPQIFRATGYEDLIPPEDEIRVMDCIDCHNRPAHMFKSPRQLVDASLAEGRLNTSLPYIRRYAVEILEAPYESTEEALEAIGRELRERYAARMEGPQGRAMVERNIGWLRDLYQENFFPEHSVDWRVYPDHIGHFEFPGCNRCHAGDHHELETGITISHDCNLCHEIIEQVVGEATRQPMSIDSEDFRHPRGMEDLWRGNNCTDCHAP